MKNFTKFLIAISVLFLAGTAVYLVKTYNDENIEQEMQFGAAEKKDGLQAAELDPSLQFVIEIKENKFVPDVLEVPAGKDFKLIVRNQDKTIEEFESAELKKEKLVKGGKEITLLILALKAGEYKFFGEFHPRTAQGKIIAK